MANDWEVRGVPRALTVDMWWLASMTDAPVRPLERRFAWNRDGAWQRLTALLVLVALADALFYGQAVGLSLAVFAAAVLAVAMASGAAAPALRYCWRLPCFRSSTLCRPCRLPFWSRAC
jgi:hypothetical protein